MLFGSSSAPFNLPLFAKSARQDFWSDNAPLVDAVRSIDERPKGARGWVEESKQLIASKQTPRIIRLRNG